MASAKLEKDKRGELMRRLQALEGYRRALKQNPDSQEIRTALERAESIASLDPGRRGLSLRERGQRWSKLLALVLQASEICGEYEGTPLARRLIRDRSNRIDKVDEKLAAALALWNSVGQRCRQDPVVTHIMARVR